MSTTTNRDHRIIAMTCGHQQREKTKRLHEIRMLRVRILASRNVTTSAKSTEISADRVDSYYDPITKTLGFGKTYGENSYNSRPIHREDVTLACKR